MRNQLIVWFSVIALSFLNSIFLTIPAYGQISWCGGMSWGLPLERNIKVNSPFNDIKKPTHYGVDYKAVDGDNVLTVADGKISKIDYNLKQLSTPNPRTGQTIQGWGRYVVVDHPDGSQTLYAHLQEGSTSHLSEGQEITKGTMIGKADTTGGATGPHLHLEYSPTGEIYDNNSKQDPLPCLCNVEGLPALTLSGPDAPSDGSQYTASGGTAPYTWTISKGSITQGGVVTVSGHCGTATITVTDACGTTQQKDITLTTYTYQIPISGPDAPTDGSQYTASGGIVPYTWSITKGYITTDGIVTVSGQCGTATITVKDKCDVTAEKVVTLPVVTGVSGPDAPVDGSQYTAITNPAGSNLDIQWSISKGSITQDGIVTVSGQCETATVTAADTCGNQATKDVRMPSGVWLLISSPLDCTSGGTRSVEKIQGDTKLVDVLSLSDCPGPCPASACLLMCACPTGGSCYAPPWANGGAPLDNKCVYRVYRQTWKLVCP